MSQEQLTHISKVQIHKLWGKYDIEWNLHKDVNILSGLNGSGKSTVLRIIADALTMKGVGLSNLEYDICYITFNDGGAKVIIKAKRTEKLLNTLGQSDERYLKLKTTLDELQKEYPEQKAFIVSLLKQKTELAVNRIQTFESELLRGRPLELLSDDIRTTLDVELQNAEILFNEYRSAYLDDVTQKAGSEHEFLINKIIEKQKLFFETINKLLAETNKRISFNKTKFEVQTEDGLLKIQKLSSGEKQLLILLTAAMAQNEKPSILLLDEPEISLHTDWQEELLDIIRTLNPNAQLIVVTHSPSMIINGWLDRITTMEEITIK